MPEILHSFEQEKVLKKLHSGVKSELVKESTQNIYVNYVTKKNSKHFIKMCGKVIATAQKKYSIQDHRKVITGCRLFFFNLWQSVLLCWKLSPVLRRFHYIQRHLSNQPRQG